MFNSQILITNTPFEDLQSFLKKQSYTGIVILSDSNVYSLYGSQIINSLKPLNIPILPIVITPGEHAKNLDSAEHCWQEMHKARMDRQCVLIGFGGGVLTDLAGFVAACYMRGVDVLHFPTTLMGMVDASMGGKSGVNLSRGKNIIGVFHHPKIVLISSYFLKSLPQREFLSGLAEVVKYGVITSPFLFNMLEKETTKLLIGHPQTLDTIIGYCCEIKTEIIIKDAKEQGLRANLNLGHTFAHALEAATNYRTFLHGEAVAIGISCAFYVSHLLKLIDESLINRLHQLLKSLKLPIALPEISPENLIELMYGDKKTSNGKLNLILVKDIGHVEKVLDMDPQIILKALRQKNNLECGNLSPLL